MQKGENMFQQDLFTPSTDLQLFKEVDEVKYSLDKLRKSFFSNLAEVHSEIMQLKKELKKNEDALQ